MDELDVSSMAERDAATEAVNLMRTNARDRAASLLYRKMGRRILNFLARLRVPEAEAEELLNDIILKFITSDPSGTHDASAIALLWHIVRNTFIDWSRRRKALVRGGGVAGGIEVELDDESWTILYETSHAGFDLPGWVKDCVGRAAALFQFDKPSAAHALLMHAQGYSHRELAAALHGVAEKMVTELQEKAAKSRVHHACKLARGYFEECKE